MIIKQPQRDGIDGAVGDAVQRAAEVIKPIVAVHSRHDGDLDLPAQDRAHHVCARAVAVDDLEALACDHRAQPPHGLRHAALHDQRVDAHFQRLIGKCASGKADQPYRLRLPESLEKRKHMCFRAADVAAGDQMHDFHRILLI